MSDKNERLREARKAAGYDSASAAARAFGWKGSSYIAHENGQNDFNDEQAQMYARAFKTTADWLLWAVEASSHGIDGQLRELDPEDARVLFEEFTKMIRAAKLIRWRK